MTIAVLPEANESFVAAVKDAGGRVAPLSAETRGIVWCSYPRAAELTGILSENPQVSWVQLPWAGVDAFADVLSNFAGRPVPVWTSAKGAYSEPVAEHSLALVLALLRGLPTRVVATSWGPKFGRSLFGLNVVIVGGGGIARELIRLLAPFRVTVTVVRKHPVALPGADRTVTSSELASVLPQADVVILAAALTDATRSIVGTAELAAMRPDAILVNVGRGPLVDTDALVRALADGRLAGAGLDVTDPEPLPEGHPLWNEPRALITSHSADTPEMTAPLFAERIRVNVRAFLGDGRFEGVVDPEAGY